MKAGRSLVSRRRAGVVLAALGLTVAVTPTVSAQATTYKKADDGAAVTAVKWLTKTEADITIKSPALGSSQKVRILVPKTWKSTAKRTWPVVYALHGGNNNYTSWTKDGHMDKWYGAWDVMVVMPEGANGSYTDWYNGGKGGTPKWETWHTKEVRQIVERNFHAGASRAVIGNSSGGGGAMTYAARNPGLYKSASSYSGVLSMMTPGIPSLLMYTNAGKVDPTLIWGDPYLMSVNANIRTNWVQHDPTSQLARLKGTRLYVSAGTTGMPGPFDDAGAWTPWDIAYLSESQVGRSSQDFIDEANKLGVPVINRLYGNGSHKWAYWIREYHNDWPGVMKAIGAKKF